MATHNTFNYDKYNDAIFDRNQTEKYKVTINKICYWLQISRNKFYQDIYKCLDSMEFPERPNDVEKIRKYLNAVRTCQANALDNNDNCRATIFFSVDDVIEYFNKNFQAYVRTAPFTISSLFKGHEEEAKKLIKAYDEEDSINPNLYGNKSKNISKLRDYEKELSILARTCGTSDLYKHTLIHSSGEVITDRTRSIPFVRIKLPIKSINDMENLESQKFVSPYSSMAMKKLAEKGAVAYRSIKPGQKKAGVVLYDFQDTINVYRQWLMAPARISIKYSNYKV
ncbi:MAG: hypothetical protein ACIRZX_08595 [Lactobacillus crispatus]